MNINATLIGQFITFFVFVWFCMKFVWPPIMQALHARQKRIADGLAAAERGVHEQTLAEQRAKDLLVEAKGQSVEIINLAQKRASEIVEEAKGDARAEGDRLLTAARAEIEQEVNRAKEQLRAQVAIIVVTGAEKVLGREIDAQAHAGMLNELAGQI
jgi:F-type H+-transporting ATPase subunit b